ncbi:MAG: hypothetical protein ACTSUE_10880 [Promethearchaeota archaeon]
MTVEVKKILVRCPVCHVEKEVNIPIFLVKEAQDGVLKIQIPQGACCAEHSFMVYIDKKFKIKGYQNADIEFRVGAPANRKSQDKDKKDFKVDDLVNIMGPDISGTILRTILIGKPILFLETFDLYNRVDKAVVLLNDMESDDLVITTERITREELKEKRVNKSNSLVVVPLYQAIMRSPFFDDINTRFEGNLINETLKIPDRGGQIIFMRKELIKITRIIDEFVKILRDAEKLFEEDIPKITQEKFNYKIDSKNIDVIKEVIFFKHDHTLAEKIINKSLDKIRNDLW